MYWVLIQSAALAAALLIIIITFWPHSCGHDSRPSVKMLPRTATAAAAVGRCPGQRCVSGEAAGLPIPSSDAPDGHEWLGGALGFAEAPNATDSYKKARAPVNATLLLIGVVSGSKNFDVRAWLRRAFWRQRAWRHGVGWRFVVGTTLPRGDNDRVSLNYDAQRHGDMDLVRGSELPPRQARVALRWWLHAAVLATQAHAPAYFALTYDAVLLSLPRLASRVRSVGRTHHMRQRPAERRYLYGGDLRWAAWAESSERAGATWRCVSAVTPVELLSARLAGDVGPPADTLTPSGRQTATKAAESGSFSSACTRGGSGAKGASGGNSAGNSGGTSGTFLAASPELQVLSAPLLHRLHGPIAYRLRAHRLEVVPPLSLWDRSEQYHQSAAGRTPSQPALLAATVLARAVYNASRTRGGIAYVGLRSAPDSPAFSWEVEPLVVPGPRSLLVRGVTNGIAAEAVVERFERQQRSLASVPVRVRCTRARCEQWGLAEAEAATACCEAQHQ